MKKVNIKTQKEINGGADISYADYCAGFGNHPIHHNTRITGTGATLSKAKTNYNSKLATHKNSLRGQSHNGKKA